MSVSEPLARRTHYTMPCVQCLGQECRSRVELLMRTDAAIGVDTFFRHGADLHVSTKHARMLSQSRDAFCSARDLALNRRFAAPTVVCLFEITVVARVKAASVHLFLFFHPRCAVPTQLSLQSNHTWAAPCLELVEKVARFASEGFDASALEGP